MVAVFHSKSCCDQSSPARRTTSSPNPNPSFPCGGSVGTVESGGTGTQVIIAQSLKTRQQNGPKLKKYFKQQ